MARRTVRPADARDLIFFVIELVDLAPEDELTGRWDVLRRALVRYLSGRPLDEDELRALLPGKGAG